jgi:hypothetical protein
MEMGVVRAPRRDFVKSNGKYCSRQTRGIVAVTRVEEVEIEIRFGQRDGLERLAVLVDFNRQGGACCTRWQRCNFVRAPQPRVPVGGYRRNIPKVDASARRNIQRSCRTAALWNRLAGRDPGISRRILIAISKNRTTG